MTINQSSINASNSIIVRFKINQKSSSFSSILAIVSQTIIDSGGFVGSVDLVRTKTGVFAREIKIYSKDQEQSKKIIENIKKIKGIDFINSTDPTFLAHIRGKICIQNRIPLKTRDELSMAYTPGVARVCKDIHDNPKNVYRYTIKQNTVAVVTDGTAVLGLGNIGPKASLPVMEGKAMLFKEFADIDAWPICLETSDVEEIIRTVKAISPVFGGINLEDISAPRCFEIEKRLRDELDIPVFHDDQHGTAVVSTAALINALKFVNKKPEDVKVVVCGAGAAGTACSKMILSLGVKNLIGCDSKGAIHSKRDDLNSSKLWFLKNTNPNNELGFLKDVIIGADVFLGVSAPNVINKEDLSRMAKDPIVFALSNPDPEISPEEALDLVAVMATGRSDYPNQINNVLCFPGIFRGALNCHAIEINEEMKLAAAHAIAGVVKESQLCEEYVIPSVFDPLVIKNVAEEVKKAAVKTGVAHIVKN